MSHAKLLASISIALLCAGATVAGPVAAEPAQQPTTESGTQTNGGGSTPNAQPAPPDTRNDAQPGLPDAQKPTDPDDEVICKRDNTTGTRVSRQKVCMTRREWREAGQD